MNISSKKIWFSVLCVSILLVACVIPEKNNPFERLPKEERSKISGEVFPFEVSVSTKATHRLEKDGRLISYIASDIIRLEDFEGKNVILEGVYRSDKMKNIFIAERVKLDNTNKDEVESMDKFFDASDFYFVYPDTWEFSTAGENVYFSEKKDPSNRVFLTFSVGDKNKKYNKLSPNILISGLDGFKKIVNENNSRERQEITLFSNTNDKQYEFILTTSFEEFEKKKSFFKLLNSFIDGKDLVQTTKEDFLRKEAEDLAKKLELERAKEELVEIIDNSQTEDEVLEKISDKPIEIVEEILMEEPETEEQYLTDVEIETILTTDFVNLVDTKSFNYESKGFGFSLKIPYGFWFKNFGSTGDGNLVYIGLANYDFSEIGESQFSLQIISKEGGLEKVSENIKGENLVIEFPREKFNNSFFRMSGNPKFRDAMWSVINSLKIL